MDVRVVRQSPLLRVNRNVHELIPVILGADDAVRMIAGLPNLTRPLRAHGEGIASLDQLRRALDGFCRRQQNMNMLGHDSESVQEEPILIAISEQGFDQEVSICADLKETMALVGDCCERVCLGTHQGKLIAGVKTPS